jgi:hypothetical protein
VGPTVAKTSLGDCRYSLDLPRSVGRVRLSKRDPGGCKKRHCVAFRGLSAVPARELAAELDRRGVLHASPEFVRDRVLAFEARDAALEIAVQVVQERALELDLRPVGEVRSVQFPYLEAPNGAHEDPRHTDA